MKKIFMVALTIGLLTGCNDFLDTENLTKKNSSNFPRTEEDVQKSLVGIYDELREMTSGEEGQSAFIAAELLSDDRFGGGGPDDRRIQAVDHLLKADENMFSDVWKQDYRGIYRANSLLEALPSLSVLSEAEKNEASGEAHFLRAYFYFQLCQLFGTVPMPTTSKSENLPRGSKEELYGLIASDLMNAIRELPATPYSIANTSSLGHANHWAAEGLLARVFLFYTGYYQQESIPMGDKTLTKDEVIKYVDDCVNNSGYSLVRDYRCLWPYTNEYTAKDYAYDKADSLSWVGESGANTESMFTIKYSTHASWDDQSAYRSNEACLFFTPREGSDITTNFPYGIGWGAGTANPKTYNNWPANDLRRDASIMSVTREMPNYVWGNDKQMNETGYWSKKYAAFDYLETDADGNVSSINFYKKLYPDASSDYQLNNLQDIIILRFADVLLMQAELEKNAAPLNKVRARVGLPAEEYTEQNLRNERHWELAFEGLRYWDLLRWHIAADVLEQQQNQVTVKNNLIDTKMDFSNIKKRIEATGGLMPIPQKQIDLSNGKLTQNPGWGTESLME